MRSRQLSRLCAKRLRRCRIARRVRRIAATDRRAGRDAARLPISVDVRSTGSAPRSRVPMRLSEWLVK